jgi:Recombinase
MLHVARKNAVEAVKAEAGRYAANVLSIIREAQKTSARTLREIAEALNARGIATARGGQWYAQSVANVLVRAWDNSVPTLPEMSALRVNCVRRQSGRFPVKADQWRATPAGCVANDPTRTSRKAGLTAGKTRVTLSPRGSHSAPYVLERKMSASVVRS